MDCLVNLIAKQAVELSLKTGFDNARQRVHQVCVDVLRAAKSPLSAIAGQPHYGYQPHQQQHQDVPLPASLQLMPLYAMSLQKCLAIRGGSDVRVDERALYQHLVLNMDVAESVVFIYPRMFSMHNMEHDVGQPCDNPEELTAGPYHIRLPGILNLSSERLVSDGMFLLDNGYDLFVWIGRAVRPTLLVDLFGVSTLDGIDVTLLRVDPELSEYASRFNAVVEALRSERARHMHMQFVREGDGYAEAYFSRFLVEDR